MSEPIFRVSVSFNKVRLDSWIEKRRLDDGSYELIGMGRCTETDAATGAVVSDKTEPTGLRGWAPKDHPND